MGRDRGARRLAWEALWRTFRHDAYADLTLNELLEKNPHLPAVDRGLALELVMGTLRWQSSLDRALERTSGRPLARIPTKLLILLRMGAYQLFYLDRIPPSAAVKIATAAAIPSAKQKPLRKMRTKASVRGEPRT